MGVKIKISKLTFDPSRTSDYFLYDEEKKLWSAFNSHMQIVEALEKDQLFEDALYMMYMATECFLKHVYCLTRKELFEIESPKKLTSEWNRDLVAKAIDNNISCKSFSHNIRSIAEFLDKFIDFPPSSQNIFNVLKNSLPSDENWIKLRYGIRDHKKMERKFLDYKEYFTSCLKDSGVFKGIGGL